MKRSYTESYMFILLALSLLLLTPLINATTQPLPVARFSFNDGMPKDDIGNRYAKAYNLTLTKDRFGNANSAYFFHGNYDSFLNLGTDTILKPKKGTISLWTNIEQVIYKGSGVQYNSFIYTKSHNSDDFMEAYILSFTFDSKKLSAGTSFSEQEQISLLSIMPVYLRQWYHLVLTYDDDFCCMYIDGILDNKAAKGFKTRFLEGDSVLVGIRWGPKNKRSFMGAIDDIEIYDRALTPAEVQQLYNAPNPNKRAIVLKWTGIGLGIVILVMLIFWYTRLRIARAVRKEKESSRLHARLIEMETKAIRSQMNPHFVFNSLNTLQRFVLEDNKAKSYKYLIEFSRLLRKLLESSESETISLKEEIEILTAYLEIEKLRFESLFDYRIISSIENMAFVYIPIMLVQPFAENAIWHGLLSKEGQRLLTISFTSLDEKRILCQVDDNGVGRGFKSNEQDAVKKKSMGIDLTRQRLELLQQSTGITCSVEIIDKKDNRQQSLGTTIKIIIPKLS